MTTYGWLKTGLTVAGTTLGLALSATPAMAVETTFLFTGTCLDCSITPGDASVASGTLVVEDYTVGSALTLDNFVSFTYSSAVIPSLVITAPTSFAGALGSTSGFYNVQIANASAAGVSSYFGSSTGGSWALTQAFPTDIGISGTWTLLEESAVPEPATWGLMIVGFGAAGTVMRRRKVVLASAI
jgi:hypothetical protein